MAQNPYYSQDQLKARQSESDKPKRDDSMLNELKDINNNTLETAINTLDIKDNLKSFEDNFKEKFSGFAEKMKEEETPEPIAEQSPDFVGPIKPEDKPETDLDLLSGIRSTGSDIVDRLVDLISVVEKIKTPDGTPAPTPEPDEDPDSKVDKKKKKVVDDEDEKKKKSKLSEKMLSALNFIKGSISGLLSRFIGYSLESIATFAKWTLIIGGLIFAVDVLTSTVKSWFDDIMAEGEASKQMFGQYFEDVKEAAQQFKAGMDGWDWNNIGKSLSDLLLEPIKTLGDAIKAAIIDGIGTIIQSIGIYANSDTIKDLGTSVRASSVEMRQEAGRNITEEGMLVKTENQANESKSKADDARKELELFQKYDPRNDPEMALGMWAADKLNPEMKEKNDAEEAMLKKNLEIANAEAEEAQKRLALLRENSDALKAATDAENAATKATKKNQEADKLDVDTIIDKENPTQEEINFVDDEIKKSESDMESGKLSESDKMRLGDRKQRWEGKIVATPDSPKPIEDRPKPVSESSSPQQNNNVQVNNKTVNNTVTQSVQSTPIKPMVSF